MAECKFADAILFSHQSVDGSFRFERIDKINSVHEYGLFCWKSLPKRITTPFVLIVQWDGYVVNSAAWYPDYRDYDYIGAKWPFVSDSLRVGNGGFSLRSKKFLAALSEPRFVLDQSKNEDWTACRQYRPILEDEYGLRFAPEFVADRFSYEYTTPVRATFGFHGLGNMWRYVQGDKLVHLVDNLDPYVFYTRQYAKLIVECFAEKNFSLSFELFARMKTFVKNEKDLHAMITSAVGEQEIVRECIASCETSFRLRKLPSVR